MGSRTRNFYNDLACRYGFEDEAKAIQELFLSGRATEAADAVPQELVDGSSLVGTAAIVERRLAAFAAAGTSLLNVIPLQTDLQRRISDVAALHEMAARVRATPDPATTGS
jgi:hypothetical protein